MATLSISACLLEPGWLGCHVITKLIFVGLGKSAEISANQASPENRRIWNEALRPKNSRYCSYEVIVKKNFNSCRGTLEPR